MTAKFVAAIDHGTTSTRCILFDKAGAPIAIAQRGQIMYYPRPGWVELDMEGGLEPNPGVHPRDARCCGRRAGGHRRDRDHQRA
jgi:hypothetical protein